ncbi:hypothetical protein M427DRAFT_131255 [Gonapodya prolifera JEL478]|uniref:WHIM1 domain-containing protein n=1 Tax=Gonapodya prolifera (strain JEL478) TaxID=1344416 RepID=A0A139AUL8_GONPJ|nr:hypothetical protein M427DRAFT_131255 [Gonapodya prolifera JEL478]|eukprot:KXS20422.1 hypothetical protein M427DRAFT_131255 [Gonapodya prolifera JEL478]
MDGFTVDVEKLEAAFDSRDPENETLQRLAIILLGLTWRRRADPRHWPRLLTQTIDYYRLDVAPFASSMPRTFETPASLFTLPMKTKVKLFARMVEWAATDHPGCHRVVEEKREETPAPPKGRWGKPKSKKDDDEPPPLELVLVGKDAKGNTYLQVLKGSTRIYKETSTGKWSVLTTTLDDLHAFVSGLRENTRSKPEVVFREAVTRIVEDIELEQTRRLDEIEAEQRRLERAARTAARLQASFSNFTDEPRARNPRPNYIDPQTSDLGLDDDDDTESEDKVRRGRRTRKNAKEDAAKDAKEDEGSVTEQHRNGNHRDSEWRPDMDDNGSEGGSTDGSDGDDSSARSPASAGSVGSGTLVGSASAEAPEVHYERKTRGGKRKRRDSTESGLEHRYPVRELRSRG